MPDSNLADASVFTSSFYNTYIREQVVVTCTSGTRPTAVNGRCIEETDTNELLTYYSGPAQWRRPWRLPWGYIGHATFGTTAQTGITTVVDVTSSSVTFTAVGNRRYSIQVGLLFSQLTANGTSQIFINRGGTDIGHADYSTLLAGNSSMISRHIMDTPSAGSVTYKARAQTSAGTLTIANNVSEGFLIVTDIGPNGNPA
jgi:hypothetical protein